MKIEEPHKALSQAETCAEEVLTAMRKEPGDCDLYTSLFSQIGDNPLIVYGGGSSGGSSTLAQNYLLKLGNIHRPHCKLRSLHQ